MQILYLCEEIIFLLQKKKSNPYFYLCGMNKSSKTQLGLVWFSFGSYAMSEVAIEFPRLSKCFLISNMSLETINWSETMVYTLLFDLARFGLVMI